MLVGIFLPLWGHRGPAHIAIPDPNWPRAGIHRQLAAAFARPAVPPRLASRSSRDRIAASTSQLSRDRTTDDSPSEFVSAKMLSTYTPQRSPPDKPLRLADQCPQFFL